MKQRKFWGAMVVLTLMMGLSAIAAANAVQLFQYQRAYASDVAPLPLAGSVSNQTGAVTDSITYRLTVVLTRPHDAVPSAALVAEGYVPSCAVGCSGISYVLDPTVLVTDQGRDFEQCGVFKSSGTITCVSTDTADVLSVSVSSGYTPLHGDTACHATVQTSDGYSIVAGTVTAGAAGTTVTTTIAYTWTDTTASVSNIDLACIQTELAAGSHIILYAEGQIASTSTNVGDSLETIWTVSRT